MIHLDPSFYIAVFGWFQDSFAGIERESPYILSVGYLKGAEQAGTSAALMLNVIMKFMNARKQLCSYNYCKQYIIALAYTSPKIDGNRIHILRTKQV